MLDRTGYELEVEDLFAAPTLDERLWLPHYLPQWSSRAAAAARYEVGGGALRLRIDEDQTPWCPEFDGETRVSSLQTGVFSGPVGSGLGQHRFRPGLVVREEQREAALYTPKYGLFELQARAGTDTDCMVAFWMIGFEDEPQRSAEICIVEIYGRDVHADHALIGVGLHPFGDPLIRDDFSREKVAIDASRPHTYAAEWTPERVAFYVDDNPIKVVPQSPAYRMQLMLGIYEFARRSRGTGYPKDFRVDSFRGYRRSDR